MNKRTYRTAECRSLPYGRRLVKGPRRSWDGKSDFRRRSLPERPFFVKVKGKTWDDWRNAFDPVTFRRLVEGPRHNGLGPYKGMERRASMRQWIKQFGLKRKLKNAADSTRIRRQVAERCKA